MELVKTEQTPLLGNKVIRKETFANIPKESSKLILEDIEAIYQDPLPACNYDEENRFYIYFAFAFGNLIFLLFLIIISPILAAKKYNTTEEGAISLTSSIVTIYAALATGIIFVIRFGKKIYLRKVEEKEKKAEEQELVNLEGKSLILNDNEENESDDPGQGPNQIIEIDNV